MEKHSYTKYAVPLLLYSLLATAFSIGCVTDDICKAKYEKTEHLSSPIAPGQTLELQNNVGKITVTGADVKDCDVTATITAKATTEEEAQKLAEEVQIKLQPHANKLYIKTKAPTNKSKQSITIDFNVTVPKETALQLAADVGEINITNITRSIKAETDVGAITCREITGDIDIETDVGEVKVLYSKAAPSVYKASIETDVGTIDFTAPPNLSAKVDFSTNIGEIETDLPLTVKGTVGKKTKGIIGKGEGQVILKTNIGAINIR
jgi:hypothetical protein